MCDCLVALGSATSTGATLFAKNSDRPSSERQRVLQATGRVDRGPIRCTYIEVPPHRTQTLAFAAIQPTWMWGVEGGVNEAGVAIGNEMIFTTLDPRPFPPALTGMDLVRLGLERAATAGDAVDVITSLLERHGQGGGGHPGGTKPYWSSFLIADPLRAYVLETSGPTWDVEEVTATRTISNRTTIECFDREHRNPRQPVETMVDPRLAASRSLLQRRPVTRAAIEQHLRSHVGGPDGWTVCMHVDDPGHEQSTTASMVSELSATAPPRLWVALGSPCRNAFEEVAMPVTDASRQAVMPPSTTNSLPVE